jgi:protein SCO1/2
MDSKEGIITQKILDGKTDVDFYIKIVYIWEMMMQSLFSKMRMAGGLVLILTVGFPSFAPGHEDEKFQNEREMDPSGSETNIFAPEEMLPSIDDRIVQLESSIGTKIRDVSFIDQDGNPFSLHSRTDKPILLQLIFTQCQDTCPLISSQIANLAEKAGDALGNQFRILSVSFDTENDTPERLHEYGKKFTEDFSDWTFAVPKPGELDGLLKDLGVVVGKDINESFRHMNFLTLIDQGGIVTAHVLGESFEVDGFLEVLTAPGGRLDLAPGVY